MNISSYFYTSFYVSFSLSLDVWVNHTDDKFAASFSIKNFSINWMFETIVLPFKNIFLIISKSNFIFSVGFTVSRCFTWRYVDCVFLQFFIDTFSIFIDVFFLKHVWSCAFAQFKNRSKSQEELCSNFYWFVQRALENKSFILEISG